MKKGCSKNVYVWLRTPAQRKVKMRSLCNSYELHDKIYHTAFELSVAVSFYLSCLCHYSMLSHYIQLNRCLISFGIPSISMSVEFLWVVNYKKIYNALCLFETSVILPSFFFFFFFFHTQQYCWDRCECQSHHLIMRYIVLFCELDTIR